MTTSVGEAFVALVESDLVSVGGQPLVNLITSLQNDKGNVLAEQAAILGFAAQAPSLGITLEVELQQQLLQAAINKLQGALAKAPPVPAAFKPAPASFVTPPPGGPTG